MEMEHLVIAKTALAASTSLVLGLMFGSQADARTPDARLSLVYQQTANSDHAGDILIQRTNGPSETISFIATATGPYSVTLESAGSTYIPYASWGFEMAGSGAGAGNPRDGGSWPPKNPLGSVDAPLFSAASSSGSAVQSRGGAPSDAEVQVAPIVIWMIGTIGACAANYAMMYATASHICGNLGVASLTSLACGVDMQVTCNTPPPPPQPVSGGGGGGGGSGNGGSGGLSFVNFGFTTETGTVTVGELEQ